MLQELTKVNSGSAIIYRIKTYYSSMSVVIKRYNLIQCV